MSNLHATSWYRIKILDMHPYGKLITRRLLANQWSHVSCVFRFQRNRAKRERMWGKGVDSRSEKAEKTTKPRRISTGLSTWADPAWSELFG
jgi:hypothetical protein